MGVLSLTLSEHRAAAVFTLYFTIHSFHYFGSSNTETAVLKKLIYHSTHRHWGPLSGLHQSAAGTFVAGKMKGMEGDVYLLTALLIVAPFCVNDTQRG